MASQASTIDRWMLVGRVDLEGKSADEMLEPYSVADI
jgi:hypothetical protein